MIDVFSPLGDPAPAPVQNWTGVPEPPGWKELTGGMSWPPTGAFPPSPPPACALVPTWPCKPWPPPPPPLWPQGWPWPLPLPPPPGGAALPSPPQAAPVQPPAAPAAASTGSKLEFPWGWVVLGAVGVGVALLLAGGGASVLADNPTSRQRWAAQLLIDQDDGSIRLARTEAARRAAWARNHGDTRTQVFWERVGDILETWPEPFSTLGPR